MRRPASASRTSGRYAVALRAILDSDAYLDAPTSRRRTTKRKINYNNRGLTGPAPSGMNLQYRNVAFLNLGVPHRDAGPQRIARSGSAVIPRLSSTSAAMLIWSTSSVHGISTTSSAPASRSLRSSASRCSGVVGVSAFTRWA
jgi:hypothetical protein